LVLQPNPSKTLAYSAFYDRVSENQVRDVKVTGREISGTEVSGDKFVTTAPDDPTLIPTLRSHHVQISVETAQSTPIISYVLQFVPFLLMALLLVFILRQAQSGGSQAMSFGRSRAKLLSENRPKVTFADVAGIEEAKEELGEVVEFLKYPKKFQALGARIPKGVLLLGPPGSGKTLLARAIAGEAGVPFFSISGSDFVEMFVGVGASRVRDLFEQAKKSAPCIVFIDEIDAVGRQRGAGLGGGHDEREQTLNQLLVEMDGFDQNTGVILIAATNRPDVLDPALLRPGRFDRQIVVDRADVKGRAAILGVHSKNKPLSKEISLDTLAKRTPGFSGADLENLLNEAALLAARRNKSVIEMADCEEAIDRVLVGPERKSLVMSQREKENTAYHESGHAVVGGITPNSDPVHKVTIIPRGMALGITWSLPDEDRHSQTKNELLAMIKRLLAGRIAEEIKFGDVTTGASNDFEKATELARRMVTQYGMSDSLGPIQYGRGNHQVFLGRDFGEDRNYSEEVAFKIDTEVRKIIDDCYADARGILEANWDKVERMVASLLEHETVDAEEVVAIMNDRPYPPSSAEPVVPEIPVAAKAADPEPAWEKPKRLPPNISPEPA
jgi:cell division protease FtsH